MANFRNWRNGPWGPGFLMMLPNYRSAPSNLSRPNRNTGGAVVPTQSRTIRSKAKHRQAVEIATTLLLALNKR